MQRNCSLPPADPDNHNEQDLVVSDSSILFPFNIAAGQWTLDGSHVTLNRVSSNFSKVFSVKPEDVKQLPGRKGKQAAEQAAEGGGGGD